MTAPHLSAYPVDHIGIAVRDIDESIAEYARLFGLKAEHRETLKNGEIEVCFITLGNTRLELLAAREGTIAKFISTRGPGIHHVCYRVQNLTAELERLKKLGVKLLDEKPRPGAQGAMIAFLHPASVGGVLTELCEYPK